jgi:transposase
MSNPSEILRRWQLLGPFLNRQQQALWAAAEAEVIGHGGCSLLADITGFGLRVISKKRRSLWFTSLAPAGSLFPLKRSGNPGRKLTEVRDPKIETTIQQILSEEIAGDPMGTQRWVRASLRNISRRLKEQGHQAGHYTVARLLRKMGYSLRLAKKTQVGPAHPDRDQQFKYIAALKARFLADEHPVISIDTKKTELIGNYRREGRNWRKEPLPSHEHRDHGP